MGQKPLDRFFQPLSHMFASRCKRNFKKASTQGEVTLFSPTFWAENKASNLVFFLLGINDSDKQTGPEAHFDAETYVILVFTLSDHIMLYIFHRDFVFIERRSRITYRPPLIPDYSKVTFIVHKKPVSQEFLLHKNHSLFF